MYYPIMLDINEKQVCIVGGGKVAYRKACGLLKYGARVKVISPSYYEGFRSLGNRIEAVSDTYKSEHVDNAFMVIAATSSRDVNSEVSAFCRERGILCNVIDDREESSFILPSNVKRGDLIISVSTSGKSPSLSKKIKEDIEELYGEEYEEIVKLLGEIREIVMKKYEDESEREIIFKYIISLDIKELQEFKRNLKK